MGLPDRSLQDVRGVLAAGVVREADIEVEDQIDQPIAEVVVDLVPRYGGGEGRRLGSFGGDEVDVDGATGGDRGE